MTGAVALTGIMCGVGLLVMIPAAVRIVMWADKVKGAKGQYE